MTIEIRYLPAEDDQTDPEFRAYMDGQEFKRFSVQDCRAYGGGLCCNLYGFKDGDLAWVQTLRTVKTVAEAKRWLMACVRGEASRIVHIVGIEPSKRTPTQQDLLAIHMKGA